MQGATPLGRGAGPPASDGAQETTGFHELPGSLPAVTETSPVSIYRFNEVSFKPHKERAHGLSVWEVKAIQ